MRRIGVEGAATHQPSSYKSLKGGSTTDNDVGSQATTFRRQLLHFQVDTWISWSRFEASPHTLVRIFSKLGGETTEKQSRKTSV